MKKIIMIITLTLITFLGYEVKADSLAMKTSLNGDYSKQTWFNGGRNNTLSIFSDYADNQTLYTWNTVPRYGYVEMCTNANITSYYSANPNSITEIEHINTNIPCNQGTMHGTIQYFLITTDVWSCSTSPAEIAGKNCVFGYSLVFYQQSAADYYIIEKQFIDNQIKVDKSSGYLIGQNNTIINQNQQILNTDHPYNRNPSETIEGQNEINQQIQAEDNLMNSLDFSGAQDLDISINPNASNFIWSIVERIRELPQITLYITSVLGLGIIKMILNR